MEADSSPDGQPGSEVLSAAALESPSASRIADHPILNRAGDSADDDRKPHVEKRSRAVMESQHANLSNADCSSLGSPSEDLLGISSPHSPLPLATRRKLDSGTEGWSSASRNQGEEDGRFSSVMFGNPSPSNESRHGAMATCHDRMASNLEPNPYQYQMLQQFQGHQQQQQNPLDFVDPQNLYNAAAAVVAASANKGQTSVTNPNSTAWQNMLGINTTTRPNPPVPQMFGAAAGSSFAYPPLAQLPPAASAQGLSWMTHHPSGAPSLASMAFARPRLHHEIWAAPSSVSGAYTDHHQPSSNRERSVTLYMPCDAESLSAYQCLARQQMEAFEAGPRDVDSNAQGRNKPIILGQVGVRCRHCVMLPPKHRGRGAVYYPTRLEGAYQACQNLASSHLCEHCQHISKEVREELIGLKERKSSAGGGKKYWADSLRVLDIVEDHADHCLRFASS